MLSEAMVMPRLQMRFLAALVLASLAVGGVLSVALADESRLAIRGSGLEIPRFVTLKTGLANMRAGPGLEYPIKFEYRRRGLPLKVLREFYIWREVIDHEGVRGWMHRQTLSSRPMVLITRHMAEVRRTDDAAAPIIARAEAGVLAELKHCRGQWCLIAAGGIDGWVRRDAIWGMLDETGAEGAE